MIPCRLPWDWATARDTSIKFLARSILFLLGWQPFSPQSLRNCNEHKRSVLVFSHTSYVDFYIFILYMLAYRHEIPRVRTLVKPDPFAYMGGILRWLGAIPATKVDEKNGGATHRIVTELSKENSFIFLISPKGTIVRRDWRSGYYNIAKKLNIPIKVTGLDYEHMCVVVTDAIDSQETESAVEEFCKKRLSNIVPLYPEDEVVEIRSHNRRCFIDIYWVIWCGTILAMHIHLWRQYC